ncbi:MAG TPA: hypothetical protein VEH31_36360 [Streptosporangiaceae bacterium]|nr:hypothetical protein [Streptosporangiaceae bacterium]
MRQSVSVLALAEGDSTSGNSTSAASTPTVRAPLTIAEDLHAAIPGSTLVVLPGAGHVCNIEAPEAFNGAVRDFLHTTSLLAT